MPGQATTGLTSEQFDELVERVGERIVWDYGRGRPRELTLHQAVKAVVMYFRTNITQELIAELLFVDQSTISRAISDLEEIIAEALDEFVPELPEEIDGRVFGIRPDQVAETQREPCGQGVRDEQATERGACDARSRKAGDEQAVGLAEPVALD